MPSLQHSIYAAAMRWGPMCVSICLAGLGAGCATPSPEFALNDAAQRVAQRSGETLALDRTAAARQARQDETAAWLQAPLTADQAARIALRHSAEVASALAVLGVADAQASQSVLLRNPFLHATALYPRDGDGRALDIGVSWDVLGLLSLPARQEAAAETRAAAQTKAVAEILRLAAQTKVAWYAHMADRERLEWLTQLDEAAALAAEITQRLVAGGNLPANASVAEVAGRVESRFALEDAQTAYADTLRRLVGLLGLSHDVALRFPERLPRLPANDPTPRPDWADVHLDLAQLRGELGSARKQIRAAATSTWTDGLELGWAWDRETSGEWKDGPSVGVSLPLFDTGQARRHALRYQVDRLEARLQQRQAEITLEQHQWLARMQRARARVEAVREDVLPLLDQAQATALLEYNAMQKSPNHLLELKRRELTALLQLVQGLHDYWQARTALEALNMGVSLAAAPEISGPALSAPGTAGGH